MKNNNLGCFVGPNIVKNFQNQETILNNCRILSTDTILENNKRKYEISIVADNNCALPNYKMIFGFSALIHIINPNKEDIFILLDTGADNIPDAIKRTETQYVYNRVENEPSWLLHNLYQKLPEHKSGAKILNLNSVFITHNHWDHAAELEKIVRLFLNECKRTGYRKKLYIYVDEQEIDNKIRRLTRINKFGMELVLHKGKISFRDLKNIEMEILRTNNLIEIKGIGEGITKIGDGIYSSGMMESDEKAREVGTFVREQSLLLKLNNQDFISVACDFHMGIKRFLEQVKNFGNLKAIIGCLYLFRKDELRYLIGIEKLYLGHWTGIMDIIEKTYPNNFKLVCVGDTFYF